MRQSALGDKSLPFLCDDCSARKYQQLLWQKSVYRNDLTALGRPGTIGA